jgi:hypothetical protein
MDSRNSLQRLLDHAETMVQCGQEYEVANAVAQARMQFIAALAVLNGLAADTTLPSQIVGTPLAQVHGLLASICFSKQEFEQAINHGEAQRALHEKTSGARSIGLLAIDVMLSRAYFRLDEIGAAKAAAQSAEKIISEIFAYYSVTKHLLPVCPAVVDVYVCLFHCENRVGDKVAAAAAINRALAIVDAHPEIVDADQAIVIRRFASSALKQQRKQIMGNQPEEEQLKQLVFLQDNQGYSSTPFLFETDCNLSTQELAALSWRTPGAGRLSAGFWEFRLLLTKAGFSCELIKQFSDAAEPPAGYPVIKGATGNY